MKTGLLPLAIIALGALTLGCPVRTNGTDAANPQYDGGGNDGGSTGGLTVADCQNPNSPNYPGAEGQINLVERVVTSPIFSVSAALDGFFISDPGGGPFSGILVTAAPGEVTVTPGALIDVEGRLTEFQGASGNSGTETQIQVTRVTLGAAAPAPVQPTVIDSSVFLNDGAVEPYEGGLVRLDNVSILLFPDGSLTSYGQFQVNNSALVGDDMFQYAPGSQEVFNSITGVVRYTFYGDYVVMPRDAADIDSQSGARTITDHTIAEVQNYEDASHPEVCATTMDRCNPVRLSNVVVMTPVTCDDSEDPCDSYEDDYGRCPCYLYSTFVADPAAVDAGGRLTAWSGIKITVTPGVRWYRGSECDGLTGQAFVDCGSAGSISASLSTNYTFAGHFKKDTASQNTVDGFPQVGDLVTLVGEPAEYFEMTQVGRLEELNKSGTASSMPLPALFDGDVEAIYSGLPAEPDIGRAVIPPGVDTEKYEGVLIELQNVETLEPCVEYPYGGDTSQMTDFGYFRVAGSGATAMHGVEVGSDYLELWDSWGGWWRSPTSTPPGPAYVDRTCGNTASTLGTDSGWKCDDYRRAGQTFSSITGILDFSYDVYRLQPLTREAIVCATDCDMNADAAWCPAP